MNNDLEQLIAAVQGSSKYRSISPELIRTIGERELAAHRSLKVALKETKSKLHQVAGAYFNQEPRYASWLAALREASPDSAALREACRSIMGSHASTKERLGHLEAFYSAIFAALPPVRSVLDLACGFNPLAIPWMPLGPEAHYHACDLYADLCGFLAEATPLLGVQGSAAPCDLTGGPPAIQADVALILKTLPVLEQVRKGSGRELLRNIAANTLVVSFPTRSLSGRAVGMAANYTAYIEEIVGAEGWDYKRLEFANELVFLIFRSARAPL